MVLLDTIIQVLALPDQDRLRLKMSPFLEPADHITGNDGDVRLTAAERFNGYLAIMNLNPVSYKRHRFPRELIAHAVWLYIRFNLSLREVDEMLLERGIEVSYETIRRWTLKFGPLIARNLRLRQVRSGDVWHLDEVGIA